MPDQVDLCTWVGLRRADVVDNCIDLIPVCRVVAEGLRVRRRTSRREGMRDQVLRLALCVRVARVVHYARDCGAAVALEIHCIDVEAPLREKFHPAVVLEPQVVRRNRVRRAPLNEQDRRTVVFVLLNVATARPLADEKVDAFAGVEVYGRDVRNVKVARPHDAVAEIGVESLAGRHSPRGPLAFLPRHPAVVNYDSNIYQCPDRRKWVVADDDDIRLQTSSYCTRSFIDFE